MPHPSARAVFSKVLTKRGYNLSEIGRMLNKTHATIIHYNNGLDAEIKRDQQLRMKYQEVQDLFIQDVDPLHNLSILELKKEVISLRKQNKKLYLQKEAMITEVEKDQRYVDIFELIRDRIGSRDKNELKNHLTRYFNGIHK